MSKVYTFPKNFAWGTATAAHQIEGNNTNSDWWYWETHKNPGQELPKDESGIACDSYNRYEEDFDLCVALHNNSVRISVEWARIEPHEGHFDEKEIEHYKKVLIAAKGRGLKTFVTLHHFTNPMWFANKGAWLNLKAPKLFANYAKKCAEEFGGLVDYFVTLNEPQVVAMMSYTIGTWPPHHTGYPKSLMSQINMARAHIAGYKAIKKIGDYPVGLVQNIMWFYASEDSKLPADAIAARILNFMNNDLFFIPTVKYTDFIGLNYYFTTRIKNGKRANLDDVQSDMGWWINPESLERILLALKKFKKPIFITENGVADAEDKLRKAFIRDMLISCHNAMQKGVDVRGYFYWSLIDNYEWHQGYWPKFGLVEIDRENNLQRKPRPSFFYYAEICRNGKIEA